ncbi:hypothetical protein CPB86DRAFT_803214 [Serendipita vermifera]|nr:hypothetical protein CPB86DRAFT_803214 [Serendipita vermifera]
MTRLRHPYPNKVAASNEPFSMTEEILDEDESEDTERPPDDDQLQEVIHQYTVGAIEHADDAAEQALDEIDDEVQQAYGLAEYPETTSSVDLRDCDIVDYVDDSILCLSNGIQSDDSLQAAAASVLTGYTDSTMRERMNLTVTSEERTCGPEDLTFNVDIDSIHASFLADDPWPFHSSQAIEMWPVGPYHRRQIGTSKFRIDPNYPGNNLDWNARIPIHHFANTPFLTVGQKTTIWAVFTQLRDTNPGRKKSAISTRHVFAFYDKIVRPAGIEVFGEAHVTHWPLNAAHCLWKDRSPNGTMTWRGYGCPSRGNGNESNMTQFLRRMEELAGESDDPTVKELQGMRFVIQRQNEKLQHRFVDIFGHQYDNIDEGSDGVVESVMRIVKQSVIDSAFAEQWNFPLPSDTQVDLALEIESKDKRLDKRQADREVSIKNRHSEHSRYKLDRVAGLEAVAGFHYKPSKLTRTKVRELKLYFTGKEATYSAQARFKYRGVPAASLLSKNKTYTEYQEKLQESLILASGTSSAIRIEATLGFEDLLAFNLLPSNRCIQSFVLLPRGTIQYELTMK